LQGLSGPCGREQVAEFLQLLREVVAATAEIAVEGADGLRIRLVTSDRDYFRGAVMAMHRALLAEHVEHEHLVIPGPHDYAFNRGPGGVEMLLWHDRVLRGEPPL